MKIKTLNELRRNETLKKRLAKVMAYWCFRNSELENLHAGIGPCSERGDFSDVTVVSPYGEIPWNEASRLDDREMKKLMIDVVNLCYDFVGLLFNDSTGDDLIEWLETTDWKSDWQDPTTVYETGGRARKDAKETRPSGQSARLQ